MITLELATQFLHDKRTQIFSPDSNWIRHYKVVEISTRSDFGYDEWVFRCEYTDCGLTWWAKVTAPMINFNSWLEQRREKQILELV